MYVSTFTNYVLASTDVVSSVERSERFDPDHSKGFASNEDHLSFSHPKSVVMPIHQLHSS